MSVLMGYSGGGPSGGGGAGAGGGPSGDLLYQDTGCGLPPYQDPGSCVGGLSPPFQESPCGLQTHDHPSHHLDSNGLGGYGSDLDSLGESSSSHLPYSPEPEPPLFSESLDYGSASSGNNNNNISADGVLGGVGGLGMMGLGGHGDVSGSGEGFVGGGGGSGGGSGGGRPRRRRRTPPKAKIDINDNSLYSVYCIFKSILSASTASTVAIDNKIEQAMDLVKSHLMFAVREEVEVLKEKISELMERINQLEYENTVLRQYATQEALQQLQQPHHSSNT